MSKVIFINKIFARIAFLCSRAIQGRGRVKESRSRSAASSEGPSLALLARSHIWPAFFVRIRWIHSSTPSPSLLHAAVGEEGPVVQERDEQKDSEGPLKPGKGTRFIGQPIALQQRGEYRQQHGELEVARSVYPFRHLASPERNQREPR